MSPLVNRKRVKVNQEFLSREADMSYAQYSITSLVRGFWDEKFSMRKSRTTEGPRSREGHNKLPLTYQ
jgi:hypothetical protein